MTNFHIEIVSDDDSELLLAMQIAFNHAPGNKAEGYAVTPDKGLVFLWTMGLRAPEDAAVKLPFKLDAIGGADFARRWLAEQDYGRQPDHDGDNKKGWCVYNEKWARVAGWSGSFVAVKPAWIMYGK